MSELILRTVTAVVTETGDVPYAPAPWPLVYVLRVTDIRDSDAIRRQIADIRVDEVYDEIDDDEHDELVQQIAAGIDVGFLLDGDVPLLADFRE